MGSNAEFKVSIRTAADLAAAKELKEQLERARKETAAMGKESRELESAIQRVDAALAGEAANAVRTIQALEGAAAAAKKLGGGVPPEIQRLLAAEKARLPESGLKGFSALAGEIKAAYAEAGAGISGLFAAIGKGKPLVATVTAMTAGVVGLKKALHEYAESEVQVRRLDRALANQGLLTEENRKKYQGLAAELESTTSISINSWNEVLRVLTQVGSTPETIRRDLEVVKALTGIYGDAETAAMAWGKALHGQFDILREHGIIVDQNATLVEKLDQAAREIVKRGGGQLEQQAKTLNGEFKNLTLSTKDLFRAIGSQVSDLGVLQAGMNILATAARYWAEKIKVVPEASRELSNAARHAGESAIEAAQAMRAYNDELQDTAKFANATVDALENLIERQREAARQEDEVTDAKLAAKIARIDALEKLGPNRGGYTKEQATTERAKARDEAASEKFEREKSTIKAEIENRKKQHDALQQEIAELQAQKAAAEAELNSRKKNQQERDHLENRLNNRVASARYVLEKFKKRTDGVGENFEGFDLRGMSNAEAEEFLTKHVTLAEKQRDNQLKAFDAGHPTSIAVAERQVDSARGALEDALAANTPQMNKAQQEIEALTKRLETLIRKRVQQDIEGSLRDWTELYGEQQQRFGELLEKSRNGSVTPLEKKELDARLNRLPKSYQQRYLELRKKAETTTLTPAERNVLTRLESQIFARPPSEPELNKAFDRAGAPPLFDAPKPMGAKAAVPAPFGPPPPAEMREELRERRRIEELNPNGVPSRANQVKELRQNLADSGEVVSEGLSEFTAVFRQSMREQRELFRALIAEAKRQSTEISNLKSRIDYSGVA